MSYNNSMSYSYCCPQLNRRFYIPPVIPTLLLQCYPHLQSQNDTSLAYSSSIGLPLPNRKCTKPSTFTLSYFRSLFNDHRRPLVTMYYKSTMWNNFNILKNFCFENRVKIRNIFQFTKTFFNFFFEGEPNLRPVKDTPFILLSLSNR
jgi:hypothetical protein